jgi:hypothetical protein
MGSLKQWNRQLTGVVTTGVSEIDTYGFSPIAFLPPGETLLRTRLEGVLSTNTRWTGTGPAPYDSTWFQGVDLEVGVYALDSNDVGATPPHTDDSTETPNGWVLNQSLQPHHLGFFTDSFGNYQLVEWSLEGGQVAESFAQRGPMKDLHSQLFLAWHYSDPAGFFQTRGSDYDSQLGGSLYLSWLMNVPT